jgi:hypothetical protein
VIVTLATVTVFAVQGILDRDNSEAVAPNNTKAGLVTTNASTHR